MKCIRARSCERLHNMSILLKTNVFTAHQLLGGAADGITCRRQIAGWIRTLSDSTGTRSDRFSCEDCDRGEGGYAMKGEVHPHFLLCVR